MSSMHCIRLIEECNFQLKMVVTVNKPNICNNLLRFKLSNDAGATARLDGLGTTDLARISPLNTYKSISEVSHI